MKKTEISVNQAILSLVLFNFGSSVVMGISTGALQDSWIAILGATIAAIPLFWVYARITALFPQKNLFEILQILFGQVVGKILITLMVWYTLHLASLVLRNFSEFTQVSSMPETPQLPIVTLMGLTTIYLARSNIHAIGKWSVTGFLLVFFVVIVTFVAVLRHAEFENLLPLMEHSPAQIAQTGFQIFAFPYAEMVVFLGIGGVFPKEKPYRVFLWALLVIYIIFNLVFIRNLIILGGKMLEISFFPSYVTVRLIELKYFLARFEGLISSNFLLAGIVKISVCLLAAAKGICTLFNLSNHRLMVLPAGIVAMGLSGLLYKNLMEMFAFMTYYPYYAFPFQVLIPLSVLIAGEIHSRKKKKEALPEEGSPA